MNTKKDSALSDSDVAMKSFITTDLINMIMAEFRWNSKSWSIWNRNEAVFSNT